MSGFKNGVSENVHVKGRKLRHLRIKAGPQRDQYVHDIVFKAKILGRREAWALWNPIEPIPEDEFFSFLQPHETVDHHDQDSLNNEPENLRRMTRAANTAKANGVRAQKRQERVEAKKQREAGPVPF